MFFFAILVSIASALVMIGAASDDIRLEGSYTVTQDQFIDGKSRAFYAKAEIR